MSAFLKKNSAWFVFIIAAFSFANCWYWIGTKDYSILDHEGYKHAYILHEYISGYDKIGISIFFRDDSVYPPLLYLPAFILNKLTNVWSESLLLASMSFFVPATAVFAFLVSKKIMNTACALSASFYASAIQMHFIQVNSYVSDFILAPVVLSCLYFLLGSRLFTKRKSSIFFGICFGLGMIFRFTLLFYMLFPICFIVIYAFAKKSRIKIKIQNLCISAAIVCFIALPWYVININSLYNYGLRVNNEGIILEDTGPLYDAKFLGPVCFTAFYLKKSSFFTLYKNDKSKRFLSLGLSTVILFSLAGGVISLCSIKKHPNAFVLFLSAIGFLFILSLIPTTELRFVTSLGAVFPILGFYAASKMKRFTWIAFLIISCFTGSFIMIKWCVPIDKYFNYPFTDIRTAKFYDPVGIITPPKQLLVEKFAEEVALNVKNGRIPCIYFDKKYPRNIPIQHLITKYRVFDSLVFLEMAGIYDVIINKNTLYFTMPLANSGVPESEIDNLATEKPSSMLKLRYKKPRTARKNPIYSRVQRGNIVSYDFCSCVDNAHQQEHIDIEL